MFIRSTLPPLISDTLVTGLPLGKGDWFLGGKHWSNFHLRFRRFEVVGGDVPGLLIAALHVQCELDRAVRAEVGTGAIPLSGHRSHINLPKQVDLDQKSVLKKTQVDLHQ